MKINLKQFKNKKTIIIVGIIVLALIIPQVAKASPILWLVEMFAKTFSPAAIARAILSFTVQFVFSLLNWLVRAASAFFNGMLNMGFQSHLDIVKAGWQVTRDLSNMFFILFMVIIAFATILRTEKYGWRKLLPKVIIIALLINFSLVICSVIIDFSNIAANFFINDIRKYTGGDVAGRFTTSLNLLKVYTPLNCDELSDQTPEYPPEYIGPKQSPKEQCIQQMGAGSQAAQIGTDFLTFVISMTVGSLVLLIAAFVLFAGGILLLIRIVFIWFLVMLAPLVLLCYIMPALYKQWQKWWSSFLSWCFFAPVYAFFIWLAIKVSIEGRIQEVARLNSPDFTDMGPLANIFTSAPATALIHYFFIIALLLGGLIAAKQLGIYGADAAMNIAQKAKQGTVNWAKKTSMRPVKAAGRAVGAGALLAGGKLFGGKLGRRMEAKGFQLRQKAAEEKQHKAFQGLLKTMSDEDVKKEMHTKGIRGFLATQEAKKRGVLREAKREDVGRAMETMRAHGAAEEARSLEELRPDAVVDKTKRTQALERAYKEGTHKRWSKKVLEGSVGAEIIEETKKQLGTGAMIDVFKGWTADIKEEAEKALRINFTDIFTDSKNIERRKDFAAITGKANGAFFGDKDGTITYTSDPNAQKAAQQHIITLRDEGFAYLKSDADRALAAKYIKASQVFGAGAKLSGREKEIMMKVAAKFNKPAHAKMLTADTWAT